MVVLLLVCFFAVPANAQSHPEAGLPFVTGYQWSDYDASPENWVIAQDGRGVMYFGNLGGVLEFDGTSWRLLPLPNRSNVRALTSDADGRMWVGGENLFGFLDPDADGGTRFVSLVEHVPANRRPFGLVYQAAATSKGVYFLADYDLFRWDGEKMSAWSFELESLIVTSVYDVVYVSVPGAGLFEVDDSDELLIVPGSEHLASSDIYTMLPFGDGRILVGTRGSGLWMFDPHNPAVDARFSRFATEADAILAEGRLYLPGAVLPGPRFVLGTRAEGAVVIDRDGQLLQHLTTEVGLAGPSVSFVFVDASGDLWLTHRRGITRVQIDAPLSYYDARFGLPVQTNALARHDGLLFAATMDGVHVLDPVTNRFRRLEGLSGQVVGIMSVGEDLLAIGQGAHVLFTLEGERFVAANAARFEDDEWALQRWAADENAVLVGRKGGLDVVRRVNGQWVRDTPTLPVAATVLSIAEDAGGLLWLGTTSGVVVRVRPGSSPNPLDNAELTEFGPADGLPLGETLTFRVGERVVVATHGNRVFRFDEAASRFVPDSTFSAAGSGHPLARYSLREDAHGQVWIGQEFGSPSLMRPGGDGRYAATSGSLRQLRAHQVLDVFPEENGVAWLTGLEKLVRYDLGSEKSQEVPPAPLLRRISVGDKVLLSGGRTPGSVNVGSRDGAVRISFATPPRDDLEYRTRLDGAEEDWTAWTGATEREYVALGSGRYTFRVQSRGALGEPGAESIFSFRVLPPWWRSWWAYLAYITLAFGAIGAVYRYRQNQLRLQHTVELQKVESDNLRKLNDAQSRFFANVSHEFRTPLTLTMGPLDDVLNGEYGEIGADIKNQLALARRSAGNVLGLVNQILDLARAEAGRLVLRAAPVDLAGFVTDASDPFRVLAEKKSISFEVSVPDHAVEVYVDASQFEKVLSNLLGNAFKYTDPGGRVALELTEREDGVAIAVRDTGRGVPSEALPHIFDRFYRVNEATRQFQPGTGIGLALSKELVELHGGTIYAESEVGAGSTFTVTLCRGRAHLADDQVAAANPAVAGVGFDATDRSSRGADVGDIAEREAASASESDEASPREAAIDQTTVLLVEDNADIRAYVTKHLARNYRVVVAVNGSEGLEMARALLPDLVVSDVMMPEMDGFALCHALKNDPETDFIPVVLLTAKAEQSDKLEGLGERADDYLTKPFDIAELLARVDNLIASRKLLRDRFAQATTSEGDGAAAVLRPAHVEVASADELFLGRIREAVESGIPDEDFGVDALAERVGMSRSQLHRKLKSIVDKSPSEIIRESRLERGAQLLVARAGTVSEVAYAVGFKSVAHFSNAFLERYGRRPSAALAESGGLS